MVLAIMFGKMNVTTATLAGEQKFSGLFAGLSVIGFKRRESAPIMFKIILHQIAMTNGKKNFNLSPVFMLKLVLSHNTICFCPR
jgi:hypothetical protein